MHIRLVKYIVLIFLITVGSRDALGALPDSRQYVADLIEDRSFSSQNVESGKVYFMISPTRETVQFTATLKSQKEMLSLQLVSSDAENEFVYLAELQPDIIKIHCGQNQSNRIFLRGSITPDDLLFHYIGNLQEFCKFLRKNNFYVINTDTNKHSS